MQESFKTLLARLEKVKKNTRKEMEINERLTTINSRLEEELHCNEASMKAENEKADILQCHSDTILQLMEQSETEYAVTAAVSNDLIIFDKINIFHKLILKICID